MEATRVESNVGTVTKGASKFPSDAKKPSYNSRDSDQWHVWLYIDDLKTWCQLQGWQSDSEKVRALMLTVDGETMKAIKSYKDKQPGMI